MQAVAYTDASFNEDKSIGHYAARIENEDGEVYEFQGRIPYDCSTSNHAELYAIYIAVQLIRKTWKDIDSIKSWTDSQSARNAIMRTGFGRRGTKRYGPIVDMINKETIAQDIFFVCYDLRARGAIPKRFRLRYSEYSDRELQEIRHKIRDCDKRSKPPKEVKSQFPPALGRGACHRVHGFRGD